MLFCNLQIVLRIYSNYTTIQIALAQEGSFDLKKKNGLNKAKTRKYGCNTPFGKWNIKTKSS